MIPPVMIVSALGGTKIYSFTKKRFKNEKALRILTTALVGLLIFEAYNSYFNVWTKNENTKAAFNENYVNIAREINSLPKETPKIVVVKAGGFLVRGIPMPSQTVMFLTNSFTEKGQAERNISYVLPENFGDGAPESAATFFVE